MDVFRNQVVQVDLQDHIVPLLSYIKKKILDGII